MDYWKNHLRSIVPNSILSNRKQYREGDSMIKFHVWRENIRTKYFLDKHETEILKRNGYEHV